MYYKIFKREAFTVERDWFKGNGNLCDTTDTNYIVNLWKIFAIIISFDDFIVQEIVFWSWFPTSTNMTKP